jgi:DNA gyrase subunit A
VRSVGRASRGVGGIQLREGDEVVDMVVVDADLGGGATPAAAPAEGMAEPGPEAPEAVVEPVGDQASAPADETVVRDIVEAEAAAAPAEPAASAELAVPGAPVDERRRTLLTVCESGYGKRTEIVEYRLQGRNGSGIINIKTTDRNGKVVGLKAVGDADDIVLMTSQGQVMRMAVAGVRSIGRATQGVRLIKLNEGDRLVSVERVPAGEKEAGEGEAIEGGAIEAGAIEGGPVPPETPGEAGQGEDNLNTQEGGEETP